MKRWLFSMFGIAAIVALVLHRDAPARAADAARMPTPAPATERERLATAASSPAPRDELPVAVDDAVAAPGHAESEIIATYLEHARYPPDSRPLASSQRDLIDYNRRYERPLPSDRVRGLSVLFTADAYWLVGDDALEVQLHLERDGELVMPDALRIATSQHDIAMTADAGGVLRGVFRPADLGLEAPATIELTAQFEIDGHPHAHAIRVGYTPEAAVPARFTGSFVDRVVDGSLVVSAEVEVFDAGHYVIDVNLFDADDTPVAWTRFKGELDEGTHHVPLRFFGKVLVDAGGANPYTLKQLRGARFVAGADPDMEQMHPYADVFTTQAYASDAFSSAPWTSPHKEARLARLREAARRGDPSVHLAP